MIDERQLKGINSKLKIVFKSSLISLESAFTRVLIKDYISSCALYKVKRKFYT